ncbi:hypothetical protein QE152_g32194 [Popillia japonica]|uniref:Uncharacterized protein n=1 Tax=Popillia japonica TaxID=7064 RepID=A0AAW1J039_POPJA
MKSKKITNLTNVKFEEDEVTLMEKGLKYVIPSKKEKLHIKVIEMECAIKGHPRGKELRKKFIRNQEKRQNNSNALLRVTLEGKN